jgi:hypothetical protein
LKTVLGVRYDLWTDLITSIEKEFGPVVPDWKFYGVNSGWVQKVFLKKRNLLFCVPYKNYFMMGMVFGEKAVAEIQKSKLPKAIIEEVVNAKKYAEGRGLRINVKDKKSLEHVKALIKIKVLN